jgi:hypothetical protein
MKSRPSKSHGLASKARLHLKPNTTADIQNAIAAKAKSGSALISALITSAAKVEMMFVNSKANEKNETPRDLDD